MGQSRLRLLRRVAVAVHNTTRARRQEVEELEERRGGNSTTKSTRSKVRSGLLAIERGSERRVCPIMVLLPNTRIEFMFMLSYFS